MKVLLYTVFKDQGTQPRSSSESSLRNTQACHPELVEGRTR